MLGKEGATPQLPREALKTRLNQMVRAWGLTPTLRGDSCLFLSPTPLTTGLLPGDVSALAGGD